MLKTLNYNTYKYCDISRFFRIFSHCMRYIFLLSAILFIFSYKCYSVSDAGDTSAAVKYNMSIIRLSKIDSLIIEQTSINSFQTKLSGDTTIYKVAETDIFKLRLKQLDDETPINLDYNNVVKQYIEQYIAKKKSLISKMLGTSQMYFPLFEEMLDKYDLPLELKYLAIVESALNPLARSKSGAMGLWQFMYNTGNMLGLNITSYVDERRDPVKSTEAACKYLEFLYNTFNDWQLALAAYNGGPNVVKNAIIRSGGKTDYWSLRPYLPQETRGYVPAFIAVNYMMNFAENHNINSIDPNYVYFQFDTVVISKPVSFYNLSEKLKIPITTLKFLNPSFKQNYIPESSLPYALVLPVDKIPDFLALNNSGFVKPKTNNNTIIHENKSRIIHTVKQGEYLSIVALQYGCSIENIRKWNKLQNDNLHTGQNLVIYVPRKHAYRYSNIAKTENNNTKYIYYTVTTEDNIHEILNRLSDLSLQEILQINNLETVGDIKAGKKIKIGYKN